MEVAQLATCAQIEYWINEGENISVSIGVKRLVIGEFEIDYNTDPKAGSINKNQLAIRARNYLNDNGLFYGGVKLNGTNTNNLTN